MKESFSLIVIAFLALIFALSIWNLIIMEKIKKSIKSKSTLSTNEFYLELKSRIQLITTIFSIVVVIITYYGFTTEDRIQKEINKQVTEKFSKYDIRFESVDSTLLINEMFVKNFEIAKEAISATLLNAGQDAKDIERNINILAAKKLSGLNLYIIPGFKISDQPDTVRCYYKNMITSEGKRLPKFTSPPFINFGSNPSIGAAIVKNTTEFFDITICSTCGDELTYDLLIGSYN